MKNSDSYVAGIGASAGGIQAICEFFRALPDDTGVCFVVILHLPANFDTQFDQILSRYTSLPVLKLKGNVYVQPDHIYILPGYFKVAIEDDELVVTRRRNTEIINTAVDDFLISLARTKREKGIGIILSGAGTDGAKGVAEIHKNGGIVLVQKPTSAAYSSMPFAAIDSDHPNEISTPHELGHQLLSLVERKYS
jgi:chemotaxis response regulator CheB